MISRVLAFTGGALIGGGIGWLAAEYHLDNKYMTMYQDSVASQRRAMEMASEPSRLKNVFEDEDDLPEAPLDSEDDLMDHPVLFEQLPKTTWDVKDQAGFAPEEKNPYHTAVAAVETPVEVFVDGGINDYGVSYIEEEEYQEDDGREKEQIVIIMDDHQPTFLMGGGPIGDWDERVGDSILVDMYKHCPAGQPQVLFVRNHKTDTDYEVVRETR